jgi:hypothetical protein
MGMAKFRLGRWKSDGGAACTCVAEPGCAQVGTFVVCAQANDETAHTRRT